MRHDTVAVPGRTVEQPGQSAPVPRWQHARARRSPVLVAAGVLLTCLGGLGAVLLHQSSVSSTAVVAVSADVSRGEVVEASDLEVREIGGHPGVQVVPAAELESLVGRHAVRDLTAGGLLAPGTVGDLPQGADQVRLGLSLPAGRVPAAGLRAGDPVQLFAVPTEEEAQGEAVTATVVSDPVTGADQVSILVDVVVDRADAARVASLAAAERIVLARG